MPRGIPAGLYSPNIPPFIPPFNSPLLPCVLFPACSVLFPVAISGVFTEASKTDSKELSLKVIYQYVRKKKTRHTRRYEPADTVIRYRIYVRVPYSRRTESVRYILYVILSARSDALREVCGARLRHACRSRRGMRTGRRGITMSSVRKVPSGLSFPLKDTDSFSGFFPGGT